MLQTVAIAGRPIVKCEVDRALVQTRHWPTKSRSQVLNGVSRFEAGHNGLFGDVEGNLTQTFVDHMVDLPRGLFETRTFSLDHQVQVNIDGRLAEKRIRFDEG